MDIIYSEVGVTSAFKDMRNAGQIIEVQIQQIPQKYFFKDASYDDCVNFLNNLFFYRNGTPAMHTRWRGDKSFRALKSIWNSRRYLNSWEFQQDLNSRVIQNGNVFSTLGNMATHFKGVLAIGGPCLCSWRINLLTSVNSSKGFPDLNSSDLGFIVFWDSSPIVRLKWRSGL